MNKDEALILTLCNTLDLYVVYLAYDHIDANGQSMGRTYRLEVATPSLRTANVTLERLDDANAYMRFPGSDKEIRLEEHCKREAGF